MSNKPHYRRKLTPTPGSMPSLMGNDCWNSKSYQISGIGQKPRDAVLRDGLVHTQNISYTRIAEWFYENKNIVKDESFKIQKIKKMPHSGKKLSLLITHNNVWSQGNSIHLRFPCQFWVLHITEHGIFLLMKTGY